MDDSAFLAFTPTAGNIYTLSATMTVPTGGSTTGWVALGFAETNTTTGSFYANNAAPWILYRPGAPTLTASSASGQAALPMRPTGRPRRSSPSFSTPRPQLGPPSGSSTEARCARPDRLRHQPDHRLCRFRPGKRQQYRHRQLLADRDPRALRSGSSRSWWSGSAAPPPELSRPYPVI